MLNYKTLGGDLLVFKNKNDCMTINRNGNLILIDTLEIDGEEVEASRKNNNSVIYDEKNTFSAEEILYFLKHYEEMVGPRY